MNNKHRGQGGFDMLQGIFVALIAIGMMSVLYFIVLAALGGVSTNANVTTAINNNMASGNTAISFIPIIVIVGIIVAVLGTVSLLSRRG
jgi:hypothetical protein